MSNFIVILYFIGLIIACFQDIKRREVDDWLNLTLFFSGTAFILFNFLESSFSFANYGLFVFVMSLISLGLYYGHFFAGGDAKLLFAMTPLFYEILFLDSLKNFLFFFIFLIFAGAIYGLFFLFYISFKNRNILKKEIIKNFKKKIVVKYLFLFSLFFLILGIFNFVFIICAGLILLFTFLFISAKSLEKISFIIEKDTSLLSEGDWLSQDLFLNGKKIIARWEGLSKKEINYIQKHKKKIFVKEGIPYVPAFLIAFLLYTIRVFILETFLNYL